MAEVDQEQGASRDHAPTTSGVREPAKVLRAIRDLIPTDYLMARDIPGAPGPTDQLDLVGAMRDYTAARWRLIGRLKKAEAERDDLLEAARNLDARTRGDGPEVAIDALWDALRAAIAKATET